MTQHGSRFHPAFQLDDHPHARAIGLIAQPPDALDAPLAHQSSDALNQTGLVNLVGQLCDNDRALATAPVFGVRLGPDQYAPLSCGIGLTDALAAKDSASRGEIRAPDELDQVIEGDIVRPGIAIDQEHDSIRDLAEVMRRDVSCHAHRNAPHAVHQQIGEFGGQHSRFFEGAVKVIAKIDRVFVQIDEKLLADSGEARLCVAHGRCLVAINGAKVPLSLDQQVAHGEILRHAHHSIIDRRITVRMVLAQHLAYDTGTLARRGIVSQSHIVHRVEDAPLNRLEPVAHIGKGARGDDAHGIAQVRRAHLFLNIYASNQTDFHPSSISIETLLQQRAILVRFRVFTADFALWCADFALWCVEFALWCAVSACSAVKSASLLTQLRNPCNMIPNYLGPLLKVDTLAPPRLRRCQLEQAPRAMPARRHPAESRLDRDFGPGQIGLS